MSLSTICFYHSRDLDGFCSGAIVKRKFPDAEMIGYDYGEPFPFDKVEGKNVIMVDVSLPMDEMGDIASKSKSFVWIDHHASAINDYHNYDGQSLDKIRGDLKVGKAACELAWEYFFPDEVMPYAVKLLGTYDVWRKGDMDFWNDSVMPFQYGLRGRVDSFDKFPASLFNPGGDKLIEMNAVHEGNITLMYQENQNKGLMKGSFVAKVSGYTAICCNVGLVNFNSQVFASVFDPEKHDIMVPFAYLGPETGQWRVSFYREDDRTDIDCSVIAKSFLGGGHAGAAGCQVKDWSEVINLK